MPCLKLYQAVKAYKILCFQLQSGFDVGMGKISVKNLLSHKILLFLQQPIITK